MALDPNIILQAGNFRTPDAGQILETRAQLQMRNAAIAKANREEAAAQARLTRLGQIGSKAATGDLQGARSDALEGGDFDVVDHLNKLDEENRSAVLRKVQSAAPIAMDATKLPYEQRRAFIAQQAPLLKANGWSDEELAALDPTDANLGSFVAGAQTLEQKLAAVEKEKDRQLRANEADANRTFQRGNAYISAGLLPPEEGGSPATASGGGDGTPLSVRLNNPGAIRFDPRNQWQGQVGSSGGFAKFDTPENGQRAHEKLITNQIGKGYDTPLKWAQHYAPASDGNDPQAYAARVAEALGIGVNDKIPLTAVPKMAAASAAVEAGGTPAPGKRMGGTLSPRVIPGGKLDRQAKAPSGYEFQDDGSLKPIKGGPADPAGAGNRNTTSNRKAEADFRKEFNNLPEVKEFRTVRSSFKKIEEQAKAPNAQNDIAMIFSYMKMLDPTSVVREGEFATAQNAAGVPDQVRNLMNRAINGERLNPQQRAQMVGSAAQLYKTQRAIYNERADEYRGYAADNGVNADRVAQKYTPTKQKPTGKKSTGTPSVSNW